jgi:glycosyltransferase involved in cell wall biosynthesis
VIAGECYGSFAGYKNQIDNLPNRDRVIVRQDYIPEEDVAMYWAAADLAVLPYKSATQSGITSIAFHFDTPVCVTDVGGLKEIVTDGKTGVVAHEPSAFSVAQAVELFFEEYAAEDIERNIQSLKKELSWSSFSTKMIEFFNGID